MQQVMHAISLSLSLPPSVENGRGEESRLLLVCPVLHVLCNVIPYPAGLVVFVDERAAPSHVICVSPGARNSFRNKGRRGNYLKGTTNAWKTKRYCTTSGPESRCVSMFACVSDIQEHTHM